MPRVELILLGTAVLLGCRGVASAPAADALAPLPLSPCHVERLAEEVLCGTHEVFEDRAAQSGRIVSIHVTVMPARRRTAAPDPLVIFAGGPGQGARGYAALVDRYFGAVRRTRDVVLIDLRGTGDSGELACPEAPDELDQLAAMLDDGWVGPCVAALDADPRHYTHASALADVHEIQQRLGYVQVNLWGGSWGTRAALLYALTYPDAVRSVVLDGAVPLTMRFPQSVADDAERAFDRLAEACRRDDACTRRLGDVRARLDGLLRGLEHGPRAFTLRHPRTGREVTLTLTRDVLAEAVRAFLYVPGEAVRVPEVLAHLERGDAGPLAAQALRLASMTTNDIAVGATMSILCSEDLPQTAGIDSGEESASTFLRSAYADAWRARCRQWPAGPGLAVADDATSYVPALILSGAHDPVTPPRWGERMRDHFPSSLHLVVPGAAHNASFSGCVPELIARFLHAGAADLGDTSCVERVPWPPMVVMDGEDRS